MFGFGFGFVEVFQNPMARLGSGFRLRGGAYEYEDPIG